MIYVCMSRIQQWELRQQIDLNNYNNIFFHMFIIYLLLFYNTVILYYVGLIIMSIIMHIPRYPMYV